MDKPMPASDAVAAATRECAQGLLERLPALAREWSEVFVAAEPRLASGPNSFAGLLPVTEQQSIAVLAVLAFGLPLSALEMSPSTAALVRQTIAQGADLADLLRLFNFGHQFGWQMWSEHVNTCVTDPVLRGEVLTWSGSSIAAIWSRLREQLTDLYQADLSGVSARQDGRSSSDVLEIVLGTGLVDLDSAGSALGCDLAGHHIALILAPLGDADAGPAFTQLRTLGAASLVSRVERDGTWSLWLSWPVAPSVETVRAISSIALDGIVAGMGDPAPGRAGFRRSHTQALQVVRAALLRPDPVERVFRHHDLRLAGTLCADPVRARVLADELLGELGADTDHCARLRETLLAYLSHACNKTATAQALHVHHKTVTYRLDQAEELLGYAIAANPLEIGAALLIKRTLGG